MSHIRRLSAVLLAAAVLTGVPYLLLWHLPWPEPPDSWALAAAHLRGWRLPPGVPTALLITVLWALWGLYAAGLAVEALARLRGVPRRLRPLGPLQAVAAAAVGTVALAPASAFADTVVSEDRQEEGGAEDDAESFTPEESLPAQPTERVRTVAGFAVGSADLTEQMREDLAPVAEMIASYGDSGTVVRVTGHTDPTGSASANMELSERRAQAVADHLVGFLGEDAPEITVEGAGSGEPRDGGAAAQRRAEVAYTVVPQQPAPAQPRNADADTGPVEAAADTAADPGGEGVLVVEVPGGALTGAMAFAGLAGGYVLGRGGVRVPRVRLSLPRVPTVPRQRRLALPAPPPRPVPGEDIDERVTVELDHVPGLGITGPGAAGAARRLIANALDRLDRDAVRVLLTEADAARLLGERGRDLLRAHPCEPVRMVGTMEEALTVLQRELHRGTEEPRPPLALVAAPSPRHETALSGLLLHGQHRGITAVVLGRWPLGGSCVIEEDGLITETSPPLNLVFHHSWPGSTADQVMNAVRAYRHSSPAEAEPVEAPGAAPRAQAAPAPVIPVSTVASASPVASAEPVEQAEPSEPATAPEPVASVSPMAPAESVERAKAAEAPAAPVERAEPSEPAKPVKPVEPAAPPEPAEAPARAQRSRPRSGKPGRAATGGPARESARPARPAREPARPDRAARVGDLDAHGTSAGSAEPAEPGRPALTGRMERLERLEGRKRQPLREEGGAGLPVATEKDGEPSRPLVRKPKKAGRGRSWRPRESG
ncbi:outer membrane protein OmpA-like peptidoglycan-associated protein [Nocardiopsis arvandica]|uniref:Outer membrane protein OmpA-like peptidoglycan-associated protein n=1 Tax=Nocardiopsis sinuspersici TaxID=501010 RepID=A0A7Z0BMI4_9ACTN|nr:OmpA family protein [Nocardiopsis sinuspersici]NYH54499.1 outer membrane protein OmpA-like peptidoglycan-associated protein [Nocardiopsis sinuspersici]